jgi:uncharacterized protein YjiS (DUF1127 family)
MDTELMRQGSIALNQGEILRVRDAASRCIGVMRGTVWITQEGDTCDHVVRAGEHFCFDRSGLALVWPLNDAARLVLEDGIVTEHRAALQSIAVTRDNGLARAPELERRARRMRSEAIGRATGLVLAALARSVKTLWGQISPVLMAAVQAVHTARELPALSDSMLKDIGLQRDQINRIAQTPRHWR